MKKRTRHPWPDDTDRRLLNEPAKLLAEEWGIPLPIIYSRRTKLRASQSNARSHVPLVVSIDEDLERKIRQLEPILAAEFRAKGLPVKRLESWQIIEWSINQALAAAKHNRTRALYQRPPEEVSNALEVDDDS